MDIDAEHGGLVAPEILERYLHRQIPLSAAMGVRVMTATPERVKLAAPLAPNVNHKETLFGGSAAALATLSAWTLLHLRVARAGLQAHLVIQRSGMEYERPIPGDFAALCRFADEPAWEKFRATLVRRGRARLTLTAHLVYGAQRMATFEGDFVGLALTRWSMAARRRGTTTRMSAECAELQTTPLVKKRQPHMSNAEIRGRFVWHELMTTDPQAAGAFYSRLLTWKAQPSGMPDYTLWMAGKTQVGGLIAQPESARQAGAPPSWLVYIGTADVDGTAAAAERLGGKVLKAPADIPNVGRFAVLADPQGATFAVFTPGGPGAATTPATDFSWHELATSDPQAALAFYSELFGWSRGRAHDMGPAGTYHLIEHGGAQVGGFYKLMDTSKAPHWLTYMQVASVDKAAAIAKAAGGKVTQEPIVVPDGSRIAQILDPQGGAFAVHELATRAVADGAPAAKASAGGGRTPSKSRPTTGKSPPRRAAGKKAPARPAKRAAAKAKKRPAAAKRATARKSPARKAAAKRAPARKAAGKKAAKRGARKSARRR